LSRSLDAEAPKHIPEIALRIRKNSGEIRSQRLPQGR
jgi:hypothetical protein